MLTLGTTDASTVAGCTLQVEAAIYIVAQTIPVVRVLIMGSSAPSRASISSGTHVTEPRPAPRRDAPVFTEEDIELVQLPSGRIVAATSEEGRAFQATLCPQPDVESSLEQHTSLAVGIEQDHNQERDNVGNDEVHRAWAESGMSKRAWSQSPSPPPGL